MAASQPHQLVCFATHSAVCKGRALLPADARAAMPAAEHFAAALVAREPVARCSAWQVAVPLQPRISGLNYFSIPKPRV